jgi:hypothetical protein
VFQTDRAWQPLAAAIVPAYGRYLLDQLPRLRARLEMRRAGPNTGLGTSPDPAAPAPQPSIDNGPHVPKTDLGPELEQPRDVQAKHS